MVQVLGKEIPVLDHGWVRLVEWWGSEEGIIEAARESTNKGFLGWRDEHGPRDERLLRYLWKKKHTTPFETPGLTVRLCCPVVVVWQLVRHRTMTFNILSGRYAEMPVEDYVPTIRRCLADGKGNKQAGRAEGAMELTEGGARDWLGHLATVYGECQMVYKAGLELGVPKEVARLCLTFGRYTRMRVTGNLHNWLQLLNLRMASDVQDETRQYAEVIGGIISSLFPRTYALFQEGRKESAQG